MFAYNEMGKEIRSEDGKTWTLNGVKVFVLYLFGSYELWERAWSRWLQLELEGGYEPELNSPDE